MCLGEFVFENTFIISFKVLELLVSSKTMTQFINANMQKRCRKNTGDKKEE